MNKKIQNQETIPDGAFLHEERLQLLSRATQSVIWDWDIEKGDIWRWEETHSQPPSTPQPQKFVAEFWKQQVAPHDRERVVESVYTALSGSALNWSCRYQIHRQNGAMATVADRALIIRNEDGSARRMLGSMVDITEHMEMEAHIRQSQKLEALGQLTGGVAHDFNNLLTVILGNAEILSQSLPEHSPLSLMANMIATAAERAADLTGRLLAFARKQTLDPKTINMNQLIASMDTLLRRTLPTGIDLHILAGDNLWDVRIDPGQMETALLNLAINACDAMPTGGQLTIRTANIVLDETYLSAEDPAKAGDYVMIVVEDVGCGMSEATLTRAIEPFFTTKDVGKGSGLGLSIVYGFVKQSEGHIRIESAPGFGTTVRLYIPRSQQQAETEPRPLPPAYVPQGLETILIVEDDPDVRQHVANQLSGLGYTTLVAQNGYEALHILGQSGHIDALFTDIAMPGGMNGHQLAKRVKQLHPHMPVLLTSGYMDNMIHHDKMDSAFDFLKKPYRKQELAQKIRSILDLNKPNTPAYV